MSIFQNIKAGEIPSDSSIIEIAKKGLALQERDLFDEINSYITLLRDSFTVASIYEKVYVIKILFVLEMYVDLHTAYENYIKRVVTLHIHKIPEEFGDFTKELLVYYDAQKIMSYLQALLREKSDQPSEELRSFFNWSLHVFWNIPTLLNSDYWREWYPDLKVLLATLVSQKRISDVMYVEFFTYHIMGNSFQKIDEWRELNQNVTRKTQSLYKEYTKDLIRLSIIQKDRKRVAFIVERVVDNSVFAVNYSLLKSLQANKDFVEQYEIAVYTVNYFEKSKDDQVCIDKIEALGIPFINPVTAFREEGYYNDHYKKAYSFAQTLLHDGIDIIINGGVLPILDFLYLARVAPLQIYYSHGNCAFDIEGIDKRVSHFPQECKEFEWEIVNVPISKEFLVGTEEEKNNAETIKASYKQKFGDDLVVLGTIGRLIKINSDEYIKTVAEIMKQNPNTIYLACGAGNEEDVKEKVREYGIDEERFIFTGQVNSHVYGWVIDVWPDSFPLRGGQAKAEYRSKNGFLVDHLKAYKGNSYIKALQIKEKYAKDSIQYPTAVTNSEYIAFINRGIKEINYRTEISKIQKELLFNIVPDNILDIF